MNFERSGRLTRGVTRCDAIVSIATFGLLLLVMLPLLANTRETSLQAICNNNLKRIGQAYHMWANDHGDRFPFFVSVAEGGLLRAMNVRVWDAHHQLVVLSNELRHPLVVTCPADTRPRPRSFNDLQNGLGPYVSYFVAHGRYGFRSELLSGDRNIMGTTSGQPSCQIFSSSVRLSPAAASWNLAQHAGMGHVLLSGGEVEFLAPSGLQQVVAQDSQSNSNVHLALPQSF